MVFDYENNETTLMLRVKAKQNKVGVFWKFLTLSVINDPTDDDQSQTTTPGTEHNVTSPSIVDGNKTVDKNTTEPSSNDGNSVYVDQNQTTVEPSGPKYVPIVRTQEVVINDKGATYSGGGS